MTVRFRLNLLPVLAAASVLAACDRPAAPAPAGPPQSGPSLETRRSASAPLDDRGFKQRQMDFLNRLRAADPQERTIDRAMLNEQNELGLVLDRSVAMDKIPALMKTMLAQMAKEFPGQDLTVLAYAPSNPPQKIGTARLNAQTRDMTYTPAQ